ncbi:MAG: peptidyl-prolyl cis-trans isomerase [Bacteroidota bacterium]
MLEAIRKRAGSLVVKILFLFLVLSFGIWGIADVFRPGRGADWAAEVGGVKISTAAFQEEYRDALRRLGQALGSPVEAEQARALGLPNSVLDRMIEGVLFDRAAADLGVTLTDAMVREQIKSDPRFRNQAGAFDPDVFRQLLRRNGFSEDRYVGLLRRDLQRQQLVGSITGGIVPPRSLVEATDRYRSERRVAEYAIVADARMSGFAEPDEPTLRQFWQDNPGLFTVPELRTVSAVILSADAAAESASVSEDDLQAAYQERIGEFTVPERRSFRQLVFADEATAQRARERLAQGAALDAVAVEAGTSQDTAAIGPVQREQLPPELAAGVFELPQREPSAPIKTSLGWHIVEVTAIEPGQVQAFAEAKDRLMAELKREKAVESTIDLGNKLEDALGRGATLQEAAAELGLPLRTIETIDARGQDGSGAAVPDLPQRFVETAFETAQGAQSPLVETGNEGYFLLQVDQVIPPAVKPFEAVRQQVEEAWRSQRRNDEAKRQADELAARMRAGGDLATLAADKRLDSGTTPPFTRDGEAVAAGLSRAVVAALFEVQPGETVVVPVKDGFAVARLKSVLPPAETDRAAEASVRSELTESMRGDILAQFAAGMRVRYPVRINPRALESL